MDEPKQPHPKRTAAATASTGTALVFAGGELRHSGMKAAETADKTRKYLKVAAFKATRVGRARYGAGTALGLAGATGLGVGAHKLVSKDARDFIRTGLEGNRDALVQRAQNSATPVPAKTRAKVLATGAAAGIAGSQASHKVFDLRHKAGKSTLGRHGTAAVAGTLAATAALPLASRIARKDGYEVTPTGVRRRKTSAVKPSRSRNVELPNQFGKAEKRVHLGVGRSGRPACGTGPRPNTEIMSTTRAKGRVNCSSCMRTRNYRALTVVSKDLTNNQKRVRVYAAGATPLVGPAAAAITAGRLAPKGQQKSAAALQGGGWAAGAAAGGLAGAHALSRAADRSQGLDRNLKHAEAKFKSAKHSAALKVPGRLGTAAQAITDPNRPPSKLHTRMVAAEAKGGRAGKLVRPLVKHPSASLLGGLAGKGAGGAVGGFVGYSAALHRQKSGRVTKAAPEPIKTKRDQREQLKRKKRNLGLSAVATSAGAAGVGILGARELGPKLPRIGAAIDRHTHQLERAALGTAVVGGGVGSASGYNSARIQRRDLATEEQKLSKALVKTAGTIQLAQRAPAFRKPSIALRRSKMGTMIPVGRGDSIVKIDTTMDRHNARKVVRQYGEKGPLPKDLPRDERMRAYEGRYVHAGGPKGEKWKKRADRIDHATGAGIAIGGAAGLTELATRHKKIAAKLKDPVKVSHRAGKIGVAAGTGAAASELLHRHAQHKQASYASSPAGVAASALRRMRDYTP